MAPIPGSLASISRINSFWKSGKEKHKGQSQKTAERLESSLTVCCPLELISLFCWSVKKFGNSGKIIHKPAVIAGKPKELLD